MKRFGYLCMLLILAVLYASSFVPPAQAESFMIEATPISQRFSPADQNGDRGVYDCMAAALSLSLAAISASEELKFDEQKISYTAIRRDARIIQPDHTTGILPRTLIEMTPSLTDDRYRMLYNRVDTSGWRTYLRQELESSRPVIVVIADRFSLFNPLSTTQSQHVVVVVGMDGEDIRFADSWDGEIHSVSQADFARAWGKGDNAWLALSFIKRPHAITFHDIMNKLR